MNREIKLISLALRKVKSISDALEIISQTNNIAIRTEELLKHDEELTEFILQVGYNNIDAELKQRLEADLVDMRSIVDILITEVRKEN